MSIKVLVTGTTGMVGEGVLHQCLNHPAVAAVTSISRKPVGISHPRLTEILHPDFFNLQAVADQLARHDACRFCLGVSSVGMSAGNYFKLTHTLTMHFATTFHTQNPGSVFCYISGAGTDSKERGKGWAAVKGKTENDLLKLFNKAYMFRPGFIKPIRGMQHTHTLYKFITWMFPIGRALYKKGFCTLQELGNAMIQVATSGYEKRILEGDDIIKTGNRI